MGFSNERTAKWLEGAVPFWLKAGKEGAFYECLAFDGTVPAQPFLRTRLQARQIFVASFAHLQGWGGLNDAEEAVSFLTQHGWQDGFAHKLSPSGGVIDPLYDAYDQAFVLFALGWWYKASGDENALDWIERTLKALDRRLSAPNSGYYESDPKVLPRRQNPHMHLMEAMLALYEITGDGQFKSRAKALKSLCDNHFYNSENNHLYEFFEEDWSPQLPQVIEPGHHAEWVYLLDAYERVTGEDQSAAIDGLYRLATNEGKVAHLPFAYGGIDTVPPHKPATRARLWVQTELYRAHSVMMARGHAVEAERNALEGALFETYLDTETPYLWHDEYDWASGEMTAKNVPASSLYHIVTAFSFA